MLSRIPDKCVWEFEFLRAYVHVVNGCVRRDVLLSPAVELNILTRKIRSPTLTI